MTLELNKRKEEEHFHRPFRVGIVGAMASGKSTLADLLGERWGVEPIKERWQENPFLDAFYNNPEENGISFKAQLRFLILKAEQMRQANNIDNLSTLPQVEIFDPTIEMDAQYAWVHAMIGLMNQDEYATYRKMYATLREEIPPIDLYVLADASPDILKARILDERKRSIEQSKYFEKYPSYLALLSVAARDLCKNLAVEHPVCVVDTDINDFTADREMEDKIATQIESVAREHHRQYPQAAEGVFIPDFLI